MRNGSTLVLGPARAVGARELCIVLLLGVLLWHASPDRLDLAALIVDTRPGPDARTAAERRLASARTPQAQSRGYRDLAKLELAEGNGERALQHARAAVRIDAESILAHVE